MRVRAWHLADRGSVRVLGCLAVLAAICLALAPALARAQAPASAWRVASLALPTEFSVMSGGQFDIRVANVGGGESDGSPVTVTDTLPAGLTTAGTPKEVELDQSTGGQWDCTPTGAGRQQVTCEYELGGPVGALAQLPVIEVPVQVGAVAPDMTLTNTVTVSGGGAPGVTPTTSSVLVEGPGLAPFGFEYFENYLADPAGAEATQAAGHPNALYTNFELNNAIFTISESQGHFSNVRAVQGPRDLVFELPLGLVGDPAVLPRCPLALLGPRTFGGFYESPQESGCPADTQVGMISLAAFGKQDVSSYPLYNLVPEHGYPAEFGLAFLGERATMLASVAHTAAGYVLRVGVSGIPSSTVDLRGAQVTFFGDPEREDEGVLPGRAFFTSSSDCSGAPQRTSIYADSWEDPAFVPLNPDGAPDFDAANFAEPQWRGAVSESPPVTDCEALSFKPSFVFQPNNAAAQPNNAAASSPAGYTFELKIPQEQITDPEALATPDLKQAVVKLPEGLVPDPSLANGLAACSEAQIDLDSTVAPDCPEASQIATAEVLSPLLSKYRVLHEKGVEGIEEPTGEERPLPGAVYLAAQDENPFHSLLAVYLVVDDPETGIVVKLPGQISLDPDTGRITATFDQNPQFPFETVKLSFKEGEGEGKRNRAPLTNPATCGTKTTRGEWTPWSAPQSGPPVVTEAPPFQISSGPNGAGCIASESEEPNRPGFEAGSVSAQAGAYSPFVLKLTRENGSQVFKGIEVTLPPGMTGKLAGIEQCSQADLQAAEQSSGRAQAASPSCPASSEVGVAEVGAGSGTPYYAQGRVYLAGPYKGAPFSLAILTPAVAGPFDLGTVLVRSALYINPETAQVTVKSDPIPTILDGIPLDVKSIDVDIDRSQFTLNPTNCAAKTITGSLTAAFSTVPLSASSPIAGCEGLPFAPSFTASTQAKTSKADGVSLTVHVSERSGDANIAKVELQLPKVLPARLTTLQKACTEKQFAANPAGCPEGSVIGTATARTPLLNAPLTGPAYLVSHGGAAFPDVEFVLQGEGVQIDLDGKTDIKKGITYSKFETVPDNPVSSFETVLPEGPHSVLTTSENLCTQNHLAAPTTIVAQNGKRIVQSTPIEVQGCPDTLSIVSHTVKGRKLILTVLVPAAGRLTASGTGLSGTAKTAKNRETVTLTLRARRNGGLKTTVKLSFAPSKGKRQAKTLKVKFRK
jgi:hypothetical protein